jgi:O-methyltransferase involved in polyketide biosynthesis
MTNSAPANGDSISKLDTNVPHSARIWNYWLGGKDNFAADRAVGEQVRAVYPHIVENARASRAFLIRAVSHLAGEQGVRQFLDLGTGLPTANNTHEIAQGVAPQSRIVYVDNDPMVLAHARALLNSSPQGATDYIDADARDTDRILRVAARTLDFDQPIALIMLGLLGNIPDYDEARSIVKQLMDGIPSGSYLVINDGTNTSHAIEEGARVSGEGGHAYALRSPQEIAQFFEGLELLEPGVVSAPRWRPDGSDLPPELDGYCGVARKS